MKKNIIILHGWGLQRSLYKDLVEQFDSKKYDVYAPDLPGFGDEPLPSETVNLSDYVRFVKDFMARNNISSATLIGHSFGGRIAAKMGSLYPELVEKIVFTGAPIVRHFGFRKKVVYGFVKGFGKTFSIFPHGLQQVGRKILYHSIGEYDYFNAGKLKKVLSNIVNEDLTGYAKKLSMPVFLIWGEEDTFTPMGDVEKIKKIIPLAESIVIPGIGHNLPYAHADIFAESVLKYI